MNTSHPSSWIELSRGSLSNNLDFLRRTIGPKVRLTSVIKGNAYGHHIPSFLPLAEELGVDFFWTFNTQEAAVALSARQNPATHIGVMGFVPTEDLPWLIENGVSFFVFDLARIDAAARIARKIGRPARLHLEVETGLYRTGLSERSLRMAAERLKKSPDCLEVMGLCTHLAGAESFANHLRVTEQIDRFEARAQLLADLGFKNILRHAACSAGAFNYPHASFDLVRFGIAQYGYWPSSETWVAWLRDRSGRARKGSPLHRVLEWRSRVMDLTTVPFGEYIGYGNAYQTQRRTQIAIVPVGYATGFPRSQSNLGQVIIQGKICPVVSTINMNLLSVDITDCPNVKKGDEVILIGEEGDVEISVASFAERTRTFNYETLVRLDQDIPRRVVD